MQATQTITITILGAPLIFTSGEPPVGRVGQLFIHKLTAAGGSGQYTFRALDNVPLPPGLLVRSDGLITGVPEQAGDFTLHVMVEDSAP